MANTNIHLQALGQIRPDIAAKQAEIDKLQKELEELAAVERYHSHKLGENGASAVPAKRVADRTKRASGGKYDGMPKHEAIAAVLRSAGRPMKTQEIDSQLLSEGLGANLSDKVRIAGVYVAMKRKKDLFNRSGGLWSLREKST